MEQEYLPQAPWLHPESCGRQQKLFLMLVRERERREKGLPKPHFTEKATQTLKTGRVVETVLSAGEDLQMNEVHNEETHMRTHMESHCTWNGCDQGLVLMLC